MRYPVDKSHREPLNWVALDFEQRFGMSGGRFTRTNTVFTFVAAAVLTAAAYAAMSRFPERYIVQMLAERGAFQYVTVLFAIWSTVILLVKCQKVALQRRALTVQLVPNDPDFVLSAATVPDVMARLYAACDNPRHFLLLNRIELGLSNLRNMGRIADLDEVLASQAESDENVMESSYSVVRGLIWAIPVLGFIGTVQGLSQAVGHFGSVLSSNAEVSALKPALRGVTAGLAVAFETTYVALVAALAIQLLLTLVKKSEEQLLDDCREYCQRQLVAKLKITPFEAAAEAV
jgi:biopolymer transport protein ExbB/TolQ